jgi:undecaprenyl-diphosphatase
MITVEAYFGLFLAVLGEGLAAVGTLVPGGGALVVAGGAARAGRLEFRWVILAAAGAAFLGDSLSYALGLWLGRRARPRWLERFARPIDRAEALIVRHGEASVVLGRLLPPTRAFVPFLAGATRMAPARFLGACALGALLWAALLSALGHVVVLIGQAAELEWVALGAVSLVLLAVALRLRRRQAVP